MNDQIVACRHLGQFFRVALEYDVDQIDFTLKALCSEYKIGIESYKPQWYSQSVYYYFEEFIESNIVRVKKYSEDQVEYEKEKMYWLGYCLQQWSNKLSISGEKIAEKLGERGVEHLLRNYKIYHTVDPMYVFEDTFEGNCDLGYTGNE